MSTPEHRGLAAIAVTAASALTILALVIFVATVQSDRAGELQAGPAGASVSTNPTSSTSSTAPMSPPGTAHAHAGSPGGEPGHHDPAPVALDMADQRLLSEQLAAARAQTARYPTVADIKAAGGKRLSVFTQFTGAHHTMPVEGAPIPAGGFDLTAIMGGVSSFDPAKPPIALYSGTEDTSVVVGLMYVAFSEAEPEGFAGPNDHWHRHSGVCAKVNGEGGLDVLLPIERDTTKAQCDAVGGNHLPVTPWMVHVWTAPGWESPAGVFSHENPLLVCRDGTSTADASNFAAGCRGLA